MSNANIAQFFETVYNDKALQGALNAALCKVAPEVVVEIAAARGLKITAQDLKQAVGGADTTRIAETALATSFWAGVFGGFVDKMNNRELSEQEMAGAVGGLASAVGGILKDSTYGRVFSLTVPGPSFVQVQSAEDRDSVVDEPVSAVDLFEEIS